MTGVPGYRLHRGRLPGCLLLLALPLAGCGFHPLYGGGPGSVDARLPDIFVANIPGRPGQQLRQALQQHMAGSSDASPHGYTLQVSYALNTESVGIHGDNTSARNRVVGRANWALSTVAPTPTSLASGNARTVDGFNNIETQYFASSLAAESTYGRIADSLADSITTQVASWFAAHPNGAGAGDAVAEAPPKPVITPNGGFLGPQGAPADNNQSTLQQIGPDGLPSGAIGRTER